MLFCLGLSSILSLSFCCFDFFFLWVDVWHWKIASVLNCSYFFFYCEYFSLPPLVVSLYQTCRVCILCMLRLCCPVIILIFSSVLLRCLHTVATSDRTGEFFCSVSSKLIVSAGPASFLMFGILSKLSSCAMLMSCSSRSMLRRNSRSKGSFWHEIPMFSGGLRYVNT